MNLVEENSPILRQIASPVSEEDIPRWLETTAIMHEIMIAKHGIGLAAPQIGISKRIFVIGMKNNKKWTFFNPEIISYGEEETEASEGCLSLPGRLVMVKRSKKIFVQYIDETLKKRKCTFEGLMSRCFQHEFDHLNGILIIDKSPPIIAGNCH